MEQPLKRVIVVLDHGNVCGGLEKVTIEAALALRDRGFEVFLFCGVGPVDPRLERAGIKIVCLGLTDISSNPSRMNVMRTGLWNADAARRLDSAIRDIDLLSNTGVRVYGRTKSLSSFIGPVVTAKDIRNVLTMHDYFFASSNGGFFDYQKNEICLRRAMSVDCLTTNCDSRHASHKEPRVVRQAGHGRWSAHQKRLDSHETPDKLAMPTQLLLECEGIFANVKRNAVWSEKLTKRRQYDKSKQPSACDHESLPRL